MRLHRPLLLGASVLALTCAAQAQTEVTVLAPIIVDGSEDPTGPAGGFVATSQASATKTDTPRLETQQTDSVVTAEQIEAQGATTLGQALNYSSGVFGEPFGLDARGDSPRLRGFDGGNSQFLNGLKLLRTSTTPSFEVYGLERVEVLHGPAGVLYGAGNPGGMINQIQKRPQFDDFNEAGLSFGTNQRAETFFDLNRTITPDVAYRFTGVLRHQNGNAEEINDDRVYLAPSATWEIDGQNTVTFLGSYQWDNPEQPTATDISTLASGNDPLGPDFYLGEENFNESDRRQINVGLEWEHRFNDSWTLNQAFRYQTFDWDYQWLYFSAFNSDDTVARAAIRQGEDTSTLNLDTRLSGEVMTGAVQHKLLFGLDIRKFDEKLSTEFGRAGTTGVLPPLSISDPSYGSDIDPEWWYTSTSDLTFRQTGLYVQDELSFGGWRASLGLRHDWTSREGETYTNFAGGTDIDQDASETTGRAGLSYVFANGLAPFVSYSTAFDPLTETDAVSGRVLDPTTAKQWEAGVKYEPTFFRGFFTASVFDLEQDNVSVRVLNASGVPETRQRGQVRSKGFELEGTAELTDNWTAKGAYSYTDAETESGDFTGLTPENSPEDVASLWVGYDFADGTRLEGLNVGGGVRYIGERFGDASNLYKMSDETLLDASVSYEREAFEARLTVQNLTDEEYLANCGTFGCTYGAGRTVVADIAYKW
ncbi:TonB-dependent siderophore receptor [Falsirhodobacter sp. 20TX0035]|uniref:TonB-dependent siderophore receptor n=1 Tax=Falsirhodobacter sp. 20TX0035 TaxID=3022019 RepID=UPI00232C086E|nr:TonB-dependent siderophore receptor [Falsirhodobacter sp. 20TX0035]MDB6454977.1 TonB-dependent siderophore receptor [Falsirhodobacter sp. 20TX0035]